MAVELFENMRNKTRKTDLYNRQLHPDERQWATRNAMDFAAVYKEKTGQDLTPDQAQSMLLANGYRLVDAAASKGPGGDAVAVAYVSQNAGNLFKTTSTEEYNNPFMGGNKNGSLTPEQLALPGHEAHPQIGVAVGAGLGLVALGAVAPTVATAWGLGTVYDFTSDAISRAMGWSKDAPNLEKSLVVGGVAGAMTPLYLPLNTLGGGKLGGIVVSGYNAVVDGTSSFAGAAMTNPTGNPDLTGALGTMGGVTGSAVQYILPGHMGGFANQFIQFSLGPVQSAIDASKNNPSGK
jgi:filamentous hemagglutinin